MNTEKLSQITGDLYTLDNDITTLQEAEKSISSFGVTVNGRKFYAYDRADAQTMQTIVEAMLAEKERKVAELKKELREIVKE